MGITYFVDSEEDSIVDLSESEELEHLLCLGGHAVDTEGQIKLHIRTGGAHS